MAYDLTAGGLYAVIPAAVLYDERLRPAAKLLYGEIVRLAQKSGYCYATNKALTGVCNLSEKSVSELVSQLREAGHVRVDLIRRNGDAGDVVQRRIFVGPALAPAVSSGAESPPNSDAGGIPKNRETSPEKSGDGIPKNREAIRCIKNTKEKKESKKKSATPGYVWDAIHDYIGEDAEFSRAFEGFLENRRCLGKPILSTQAINLTINRLRRVNDREAEIHLLEDATNKNWLTVYPRSAADKPAQQEGFGWE